MKIFRFQFAGGDIHEYLVIAPSLKVAIGKLRRMGEHREPAAIQRLVGKVVA